MVGVYLVADKERIPYLHYCKEVRTKGVNHARKLNLACEMMILHSDRAMIASGLVSIYATNHSIK